MGHTVCLRVWPGRVGVRIRSVLTIPVVPLVISQGFRPFRGRAPGKLMSQVRLGISFANSHAKSIDMSLYTQQLVVYHNIIPHRWTKTC